jgi:hypothetical protein
MDGTTWCTLDVHWCLMRLLTLVDQPTTAAWNYLVEIKNRLYLFSTYSITSLSKWRLLFTYWLLFIYCRGWIYIQKIVSIYGATKSNLWLFSFIIHNLSVLYISVNNILSVSSFWHKLQEERLLCLLICDQVIRLVTDKKGFIFWHSNFLVQKHCL